MNRSVIKRTLSWDLFKYSMTSIKQLTKLSSIEFLNVIFKNKESVG